VAVAGGVGKEAAVGLELRIADAVDQALAVVIALGVAGAIEAVAGC